MFERKLLLMEGLHVSLGDIENFKSNRVLEVDRLSFLFVPFFLLCLFSVARVSRSFFSVLTVPIDGLDECTPVLLLTAAGVDEQDCRRAASGP